MIPTPWLLIPALSLLAYAGVMTYLYKDVVDDYANFRAELVSIQKQAEADAAAKQLRSEKVTADVSLAWAAALDAARRPVVRVRPATCDSNSKGGTVSTAAQGLDVGTSQPGLGREIVIAVEQCEERLNWAAQDAAQVITLIDWIRKTHEASK
jgi:hypothetical protein